MLSESVSESVGMAASEAADDVSAGMHDDDGPCCCCCCCCLCEACDSMDASDAVESDLK